MNRNEASSSRLRATFVALKEVAQVFEGISGVVLVGGTIPTITVPQNQDPHQGTVDTDMAIDPLSFKFSDHLDFHHHLEKSEFIREPTKPFRYSKRLRIDGEEHFVLLELLCGGEPSQNGLVQIPSEDLYLSTFPGIEVAHVAPARAAIPQCGEFYLNIASTPAFLAMKAIALDRRERDKKLKDAYDIVYILRNYPGGVETVAREYCALLPNAILEEGIRNLTVLFSSVNSVSPQAYAAGTTESDTRMLLCREAYERVNDLLDRLP